MYLLNIDIIQEMLRYLIIRLQLLTKNSILIKIKWKYQKRITISLK